MTKRGLIRASLLAFVLVAAIAGSRALVFNPVYATVLSFTSGSTQSTVQVIVSNSNPFSLGAHLTLIVEQTNGVTRTWPAGVISIPPGNSNHRVIIPAPIAGVRWARVTNYL